MGLALWPSVAALLAGAAVASEPWGSTSIWSVGKPQGHVEVRDDVPAAAAFFREYVRNEGGPFEGFGKPVLFKGAARRMPAHSLWTDEYLRRRFGKVQLDQVETEKVETRTKYPIEDYTLSQFLDIYQERDIYAVASTPKGMSDEVYLLPPMNCGGFQHRLSEKIVWFSSGGTKSVIHNDQQENIHCMLAGQKNWIMWHPDAKIDTPAMGWVDAEEAKKHDPNFKDAYGNFGGRVEVDNVNLARFPGWKDVEWWNMTLAAGDCAYIPGRWFHHVEAPRQRAISTHVWFHKMKSFDQRSCRLLEEQGHNISDYLLRQSDCTWGFGMDEGRKPKPTKCRVRKPLVGTEEL